VESALSALTTDDGTDPALTSARTVFSSVSMVPRADLADADCACWAALARSVIAVVMSAPSVPCAAWLSFSALIALL
jgi:hypothetical protein